MASDPALFSSYFWWRDYYTVSHYPATLAAALCKLCFRLHRPATRPAIIAALHQYWAGGADCKKPPFIEV